MGSLRNFRVSCSNSNFRDQSEIMVKRLGYKVSKETNLTAANSSLLHKTHSPMNRSARELANLISRALISASDRNAPTGTWTPSLEQTLHRLRCRDSLNPFLVARVIDPFLLNHHSLALGFFNWASQQPGFSHSSLSYQSVLKSLAISRQFHAVQNLLKQVKAQKIELDPSVYRSVITSHIVGKKTQIAFSIFNEVSSSMISDIGPETCNSLLAALASDGDIGCSRKVFDEMIARRVNFNTLGFGVFIWRFCGNAGLDWILGLLDEVRKIDFSEINGSIIAALVVHGLCFKYRVKEAVFLLDELRERDCKPDFIAYRIVAEAFRLTGSVTDVERVLKMKRKLGVTPRANDYTHFIFALISKRLVCEAKELGEAIISGNFPIEDNVLNALIGSVSTIDPTGAMLFFKFMIGKERFPTLLTLSNLSSNLCKHGKVDELMQVFEILSAKEYFANRESYNVMISFLCKGGKVKEAYRVLQEMKRKGIGADIASYNSIMEACCRDDLLRPAKRLWDEMFACGCGGNLKTYSLLIQKFTDIGQVEEAHSLFGHMLEKGVAPDAATYTHLLQGLCQESKIETALEIFAKSVEQDALLAKAILNNFVLSLCRGGHFAAASKLLCEHCHDSDGHFILLKCLADAGNIPNAVEHLKWVKENLPASMLDALCTELLASVSFSSEPEKILLLVQAVRKNFLLPKMSW